MYYYVNMFKQISKRAQIFSILLTICYTIWMIILISNSQFTGTLDFNSNNSSGHSNTLPTKTDFTLSL